MIVNNDTFQSVIIIGNGFDLNLGLKTSYTDFIESQEFDLLIKSNNNLALHLKNKKNLQNWIDIENELKIFSGNRNEFYIEGYKNEFIDLSNALKSFLKKIEYININKESPASHLIKKIINDDFLILDFNYTNTVKTILSELSFREKELEKRLIKIHGSIDEKIVFGVEDNVSLNPKHIFLRKAYNEDFKPTNIHEKIKHVNELYIFGHSLGETDHMYFIDFFKEISSSLNTNTDKKISLYFHGNIGYDKLMMQLDVLTSNNLTKFKQNNEFKTIDTSK